MISLPSFRGHYRASLRRTARGGCPHGAVALYFLPDKIFYVSDLVPQ